MPAVRVFAAEVVGIEDLSPTFRRLTLGGEGLQDLGIADHPRDRRFKLIVPPAPGAPVLDLPAAVSELQESGMSWYQAWLELDEARRGRMRTYTVREWRDASRELVVDMVLHVDEHGRSGPAAAFAMAATAGTPVHLVGPDRRAEPSTAAVDFRPGPARHVLLAGDETAVPAVASILDHLAGSGATGHALLEVPTVADRLPLPDGAEGMRVTWLPRDADVPGRLLGAAVRDVLREDATLREAARRTEPGADGPGTAFYAWLAAESEVVKGLRRHLVRDLGIDRDRVTFSGYWKRGRAEGEPA